ncbi:EamA family transporter [Desulfonema ishimotonii]|uniref:EamA family transporter n=1 Tax=Desulfonema ishimotonii TaxID=45657 RepID=A0A401G3S0_9BACT|nr:DMT family transporter [Desulfonema ishimotonii]GBC63887.1 EamA family transporter [Desulfonema ishimotonii]
MLIYVKLLLTALFWGGTFVSGRMLSDHVAPCSAAFLRFSVAGISLLLLTWKTEGRLPPLEKEQLLPVILLGLTGVFSYNIFFFKGLKLISAGRASLIIAINPVFITLLSAFFFRERLNALKLTGIFLSVTGAVVVISRGDLSGIMGGGLGWGELMIFGCVASWVTFSLIGKTVLSGLSPLVSITYAATVGAAALFVPAYMEGVTGNLFHYSGADWFNIVYLGLFGTVAGFVWYYQGIKSIGPTRAGLFINFVPISAILLAFIILNEPVTASLFVGALLVSSGVWLTNTNFERKTAPVTSEREATG